VLVKMACPALSVLVASAVAPSLNVTVPVGSAVGSGDRGRETHRWPYTEGFTEDELNAVVVTRLVDRLR